MSLLFAETFARLDDPTFNRFVMCSGGGLEASAAADCGQDGTGLIITPLQSYKSSFSRRVNNVTRLHQVIYLHPNGVSIPTTRSIVIARNEHSDATNYVYKLWLNYTTGTGYFINGAIETNTSSYSSTDFVLDNQANWNIIEMDWLADDATGYFKLWINGTLKWNRTAVNGNLRVNWPCLGSIYPAYAMSGSFYCAGWKATNDDTELTPPWIVSATVENAAPARVVVVLPEIVSSADFKAGATVTVNSNPATISTAVLQGDNKTVWFTLSANVANGDTVAFNYVKASGSIVDAAGNTLPSYVAYAVTNNVLPPSPPTVVSIEVGTVDQNNLAVLFSETVHSADFSAGVPITVNGGAATISSATLRGDGVTVDYVLSANVIPSDTVLWSYDPASGGILDVDNTELETVTNHAVVNNTAKWYIAWIDFSTGDTTQFTSVTDPDSDVSVGTTGAMDSETNAMSIIIDDNNPAFGSKTVTGAAGHLRDGFYLDVNTIAMAAGNEFICWRAYYGGNQLAVLYLAYNSSKYQLCQGIFNDAATGTYGAYKDITDAPHNIELHLTRAATSISSDGTLELIVDGSSKETLTGIDNYHLFAGTAILQHGAVTGVDTGTRGTIFLAKIAARDTNVVIGA